MFCRECGKELSESENFCNKCGARRPEKLIPDPIVEEQPKKEGFSKLFKLFKVRHESENENAIISLQFKLEKTCECAESIRTIAMSPNGKYFVTGHSKDGGLTIWDASTFKEVKDLCSDRIISVAFSPDSNYIVASDSFIEKKLFSETRSYYINVYAIKSGEGIIGLDCGSHNGFCDSLSFSPNGKRIVGIRGGTPRLWNAKDGQQLLEFPKEAEKIIFHPKENKLISFYNDVISIWDEDSAEEIEKIVSKGDSTSTANFKSIVFSANGQYLAAGTNCGKIFIWNFKNLECIKGLQVADGNEELYSISFNPRLNNVVAFSTNESIKIWDMKGEKEIKKLSLENSFWVSFTPDGKSLLAESGKKVIEWSVTKEM